MDEILRNEQEVARSDHATRQPAQGDLELDCDEVWENERTPTSLKVFRVHLHSMELSVRRIVAVLELLGIKRSPVAVWNWTHKLSEAQRDPSTAQPSRAPVDENQIEVNGERKWLYPAIATESKQPVEIDV